MIEQELNWAHRAPHQIRCSTLLNATTEEVWPLLADPERWSSWFPAIKSGTWTSPAPFGVGSTRSVSLSTTTIHERILVFDENRSFAFTGTGASLPLFRSLVEHYSLEPDGQRTRFALHVGFELRWLPSLLSGRIERSLTAMFEASTRSLASLVQP